VTNNGNHVMAGLAWLGGFGDLTVTNPIPVETVFVFYSEGGKKLESIAHKKWKARKNGALSGKAARSSPALKTATFTAAFLPSQTEPTPLQTRYWKCSTTSRWMGKTSPSRFPKLPRLHPRRTWLSAFSSAPKITTI